MAFLLELWQQGNLNINVLQISDIFIFSYLLN